MPPTKAQKVANKEEIFRTILAHREQFRAFGAARLGLFGSFVRGEQKKRSDVDLLIEFQKDKKSFDNLMDSYFLLEEILNRKVDLLTLEGLHHFVKPRVLAEVEYVALAD